MKRLMEKLSSQLHQIKKYILYFCILVITSVFFIFHKRYDDVLFTYEEVKALNGGGAFIGRTDGHGKTTWHSKYKPTRIVDIKGETNGLFQHHSSIALSGNDKLTVRPRKGGDWTSWSVPDGFSGQVLCDVFENMENEILFVAREVISDEETKKNQDQSGSKDQSRPTDQSGDQLGSNLKIEKRPIRVKPKNRK